MARLEERRDPEPIGGQQAPDERCQADPIASRERLAKPADEGHARVDPGAEPDDDANERTPDGETARLSTTRTRPRRDLASASSPALSPPSGPRPSSRSSTTSKVSGSEGSDWPRERTSTTGPPTPRATSPAHAPHERGTMPLQDGLGTAHPRRAPPTRTIPALRFKRGKVPSGPDPRPRAEPARSFNRRRADLQAPRARPRGARPPRELRHWYTRARREVASDGRRLTLGCVCSDPGESEEHSRRPRL